MKKKRARTLIALVICVVVALAAVRVFGVRLRQREDSTQRPTFAIYVVERAILGETVEVSGNIEAITAYDMSFSASGSLVEITVEEGDTVASGQLVARREDSSERYEVASVALDIETERISGSSRNLQLLELEYEVKRRALDATRIVAPASGVVSEIDADIGDYISAGDTVVRVIDRRALIAEVEVDELDAPIVQPGQSVRFFFDALPDTDVAGVVAALPVEGRVTDQELAVLDVTLAIDDPPAQIVPGYSFVAEIVVSAEEEILVVDSDAVMNGDGGTFVLKAPEGEERPTPTPIQAVDLGDGRHRVVSGVVEGADLVVPIVSSDDTAGRSRMGLTNLLNARTGGGPPGGRR